MAAIHCLVVTPEQTVLDMTAKFIAVPMYDGEMGIGENHAPTIGRLGYGVMRIESETRSQVLYVDGGFVQINNNEVTILTGRAIPPEEIDVAQAEAQLVEATKSIAPSAELAELKARQIEQARNQVRIGKKAAK
ncbi:ATP synthase F1 subunit epsilon [bacterium]|nr:ATP synthase F1 subunit epsilon [bacterium]